MRRLYLHIGSHKTGTTALQQSLHHNSELLAANGASFVSSQTAAHLHTYLGPRTPSAYIPDGFMVLDPEELAKRLSTADQELVIASSENFSFFLHRAPIETLERTLRPHFDEIRILCYLRRQDRHAISHHQEGARMHRRAEGELWGHAPSALPLYSPGQDLYLNYDRKLGLWADVFGPENLDLKVYDRALLKDGEIFADVLATIGLTIGGLLSVGEKNTSLGAAQTKLGHLMNEFGIPQKIYEGIMARVGSDGRLLPAQTEARAFLERYRESNRRLNARFQISPLPDLFNDDFDDFPETSNSDWTESDANDALRAVLSQLTVFAPALMALTADDLRTAALSLQSKAPEMALRLVTAAQALRPTGLAIAKLKADLEHTLEQP
jgi:hypothetical protein